MHKTAPFLVLLFAICSCQSKIDQLVYNATIYTLDSAFSVAQAMAVNDGKILATGTRESLEQRYDFHRKIDAHGRFIYPGFIDAHAHFYQYGLGLRSANLVGTSSWEEVIDKLKAFAANNRYGWIRGRGWDQNDWAVKEFPNKQLLDSLFPGRPVYLTRVDGHAAIASQRALDLAGIHAGDTISGGVIETAQGKLTGILIDNAKILVSSKIPHPTPAQIKEALMEAQQNCFAVGLTTIDDCGLDQDQARFIDSIQRRGDLKMRMFVMLSDRPENYSYLFSRGQIKTERLNIRSFKVYADGALGSRGACLLQPYSDRPGWQGFLLSPPSHFDSVAAVVYKKGFQLCTHAIGDSANRIILNTYAKYLKKKNDRRWRIEHAQVVNPADFVLFGRYSVIPSVQPTHATSDMYWAAKRLGTSRVKGAYAFKKLMEQNGWLPLGTDFPVEDISPFKTFYAAVARKDARGWPASGFHPENALTREQALRGMTIWAARGNFEEDEKGSLEKGKWADYVMLDKDLMKTPLNEILQIHVLATFINGEKVFEKKKNQQLER